MSRHRGPSGPAVSLFPFLAVLLCTMGALLVVLVIFSRSAAEQAGRADGTDGAAEAELEAARDAFAARIAELEAMKRRSLDRLANARLRLAGIEDNARGLQDEMASAKKALEALLSGRGSSEDDAHDDELARRLVEAERELEKVKMDAGTREPAYAVVPYEGSGATRRRPLYIECCGDGVFLQPEGVRLNPGDFEGPPGPGNPLASALRAAREHLVSRPGASGSTDAQPYPLFLVRPSGVMAYYAAREAIGSWGSDFGYQLVDEDWTLAFPAADPELADVEQRSIDEARARLQWLADVRPKRPSRPAPKYRAATTRGGVVSTEGPSVLGDQSRFDWTDAGRERPVEGTGGRTGSGFGGGSGDDQAASAAVASTTPRPNAEPFVLGGGKGGQGSPGGVETGGTSAAGWGSGAGPGRRPDNPRAGDAGPGSPAPPDGSVRSGYAAASAGSTAAAGSAGEGGGTASGVGMPGLPQQQVGPPAGAGSSGGSAATAEASLAQSRGSNWASLASRDNPIPLSRPIQIECSAGEFRLYDDDRRRVVARVPIEGPTATAIDPLVKAVHGRVATWGIAGDRMYWKPQLFLSETPDGAGRRADLERLLADSGLETFQRGSTVTPLPAVTSLRADNLR